MSQKSCWQRACCPLKKVCQNSSFSPWKCHFNLMELPTCCVWDGPDLLPAETRGQSSWGCCRVHPWVLMFVSKSDVAKLWICGRFKGRAGKGLRAVAAAWAEEQGAWSVLDSHACVTAAALPVTPGAALGTSTGSALGRLLVIHFMYHEM